MSGPPAAKYGSSSLNSARNIGAPLIAEGASMSYIDMLYLGVVLVAFLGFGGTLLYCSERWSNRQPPTRLEGKRSGGTSHEHSAKG
jgi:hypothetical protein